MSTQSRHGQPVLYRRQQPILLVRHGRRIPAVIGGPAAAPLLEDDHALNGVQTRVGGPQVLLARGLVAQQLDGAAADARAPARPGRVVQAGDERQVAGEDAVSGGAEGHGAVGFADGDFEVGLEVVEEGEVACIQGGAELDEVDVVQDEELGEVAARVAGAVQDAFEGGVVAPGLHAGGEGLLFSRVFCGYARGGAGRVAEDLDVVDGVVQVFHEVDDAGFICLGLTRRSWSFCTLSLFRSQPAAKDG